jgi:predicted DNA-binding transcriptional regulator AlpA
MSNTTTIKETMGLLDIQETANYLGFSKEMLQIWRDRNMGPRYLKLSDRRIFYKKSDINEWINQHWVTHDQKVMEAA